MGRSVLWDGLMTVPWRFGYTTALLRWTPVSITAERDGYFAISSTSLDLLLVERAYLYCPKWCCSTLDLCF